MNSDFVVAVHALVFLSHRGELLSSEALADNVCTHPARVRRVMAQLRRAGLVETHEGRTDGGYCFRADPKTVTLGDISRALEVRFADFNWSSGDRERACLVCSGMSAYMRQLESDIDGTCRSYLDTIRVADVERWLVERDAGEKRKKESDPPPKART